jgi:uncharacterized protein (DUF4415 family)
MTIMSLGDEISPERQAEIDARKAAYQATHRESDIDFSDIPDMSDNDEFWENAVVRWPSGKETLTLTIDKFIVDYFKQHGADLESDINEVLRTYVASQIVEKSKEFYAEMERQQQKQPE